MFEIGRTYRIFLQRSGNLVEIEGTLLNVSNDLLMLDVEGVETIFHLRGGSVAYVEVVDAAADEARTKARGERMLDSFTVL